MRVVWGPNHTFSKYVRSETVDISLVVCKDVELNETGGLEGGFVSPFPTGQLHIRLAPMESIQL